jgi:hypothetical protein
MADGSISARRLMRGLTGSDAAAGDTTAAGDATAAITCPGAKPNQTNTGVPPGTHLTVVASDVTVTSC